MSTWTATDTDHGIHITGECSQCGHYTDRKVSAEDLADIMADHEVCFNCAYWIQQSRHRERAVVTSDWVHYRYDSDTMPTKGSCGRRYVIRWEDGSTSETDDLWYQGEIPERHRHRFTVNGEIEHV